MRLSKKDLITRITRINRRLAHKESEWRLVLSRRYDYYVVETQTTDGKYGRDIGTGNVSRMSAILHGFEEGLMLN